MSSGATPEVAVKVLPLFTPPQCCEPPASPGQLITSEIPAQSWEALPSNRGFGDEAGAVGSLSCVGVFWDDPGWEDNEPRGASRVEGGELFLDHTFPLSVERPPAYFPACLLPSTCLSWV